VLHLHQPLAGKQKFHVLIAAAPERSLGFIINSRPSPFIQRRPELLCRQVAMLSAVHPFMQHDSVIACHEAVRLPPRDELIDRLIEGSAEHIGHVHQTLFGLIAQAAAGSSTIAERDATLIVRAFAPS